MSRPARLRGRRVLAAVAALLALPPAWAQTAYPTLGRLFTTPAERIQLERQRYSQAASAALPTVPLAPAVPAPVSAPPPPPAPPVSVAGVVRRSDGQATVFVDGEARETTLERIAPGAPIPVQLDGRNVPIKPGQTWDPADGTVRDPQ